MVQLLVSVRSADEVEAALEGGADIIDAKEPGRGSLGAVSPAELTRILAVVPDHCPFSIALGDVHTVEEVHAALDSIRFRGRSGPVYLKLGFAGVGEEGRIQALIEAASRLAGRISPSLHVVPVAYADAARADTIPPSLLLQLAGQARAPGVLLDTQVKDGKRLLDWLDPSGLQTWVAAARGWEMLAALAGSLGPSDIEVIHEIGPDVVGVRGAACAGGRDGRVAAGRVSALRRVLDRATGPATIGK
jgi:(5-formylfuran-3-yl)methyl phosphate synthase